MSFLRQYLVPLVIILIGLALGALIIFAGSDPARRGGQDRVLDVRTALLVKQNVRTIVTAYGEVQPKAQSNLVAEVDGKIVAISPSMVSGGFFSEGEVLIEIEQTEYRAALTQARAGLAASNSELANAQRQDRRIEELSLQQSVSESHRDDVRNRLRFAEASLQAASAELELAELNLERTRFKAPFRGRVRSENVDVGQYVRRGETLASLYSIEAVEIRLPVRDDEVAFLSVSLQNPGEAWTSPPRVLLNADFLGAPRTWEGRVVRTDGALDAQTRLINLIVEVEAPYDQPDSQPPLTVGQFVEAEIWGEVLDDVVVVPRSVIREEGGIYTVNSREELEFHSVDVVRVQGDIAYVRTDLEEGVSICLTPMSGVVEGQRVRAFPAGQALDSS